MSRMFRMARILEGNGGATKSYEHGVREVVVE